MGGCPSRHVTRLLPGLTAFNHGQQLTGKTAGTKHPDTQEPIGTCSPRASNNFFSSYFFFSVLKACDWPSHTRADPSQSQGFPKNREGCYPPAYSLQDYVSLLLHIKTSRHLGSACQLRSGSLQSNAESAMMLRYLLSGGHGQGEHLLLLS